MTRSKKTGSVPSAAPRVVIDPALLLRALLRSGGEALSLRRAWQQGLVCPLVSADSVRQLLRALSHPAFGLQAQERQELLADFLPYADVVKPVPGARIAGLQGQWQTLVELAIQGGADLLLSDREALAAWSARTRSSAARQLCAISDLSSWKQALTPGQRAELLC